nr:DUF2723 domain-containing protein [Chloroflexota bacterium]
MNTLLAKIEHLWRSEKGERQWGRDTVRPYLPLLSVLALGFYVSRIFVEVFPYPIPFLLLWLASAAIAVLAGGSLILWGRKRPLDSSPFLILYLYILWPWQSPTLACSIGFIAIIAFAHSNMRQMHPSLKDGILFIACLVLYVHTLAPTILPADSGEFQLVAHVLGIAHPPGYPFYTMLAKLFTFIPWGDIAHRVNLLSAVTSAFALLTLSSTVRCVTGSGMAGWIAAAMLGVAPTFWAQSTTANIRSLTALFTALQLHALVAYAEKKQPNYLLVFAFVLGLGLTHHSSLLLLAPPYIVFLLLSDPALLRKPRVWLRPLLAFLLSLSILLYLPLRSAMGAPFDPQPIRSLSGFLNHVLALGFRGDMFYFVQPSVLLARLRVLGNILALEFTSIWLVWGIVGTGSLLLRRKKLLLLYGGVFLVNALTAATYRAPQTVEYLMPAYVALAFICAYGAWSFSGLLRLRSLSSLVLAIAMLVPAVMLWRNYPSFRQLSRDVSARQYAEGLLAEAPQGACILANWHYATPLWYLQRVEKVRPDVEVLYVYPEGAEPIAQTWLRRLKSIVAKCPTIVTNYYPEFQDTPYTFQPFAGAFAVQTAPIYQIPGEALASTMSFDNRIELVGYRLEKSIVSPADTLILRTYWRPIVRLERDYSFFVHLVDETGTVLGQGDTTHPAARYEVSQVVVDEYRIPLLPTARPGHYRLIFGVYITLAGGGWQRLTTADGGDMVSLTEVAVEPSDAAPVTLHELYRPFACGYTLLGADYDRSLPDQLRVYLHWRADHTVTEQWRAVVFSKGSPLAMAALPALPKGTYCTTAHDLPAEAASLALEVQTVAGASSAWLGPWKIPLGSRVNLPMPWADARYIPLGGEMILVRAEYPLGLCYDDPLHARATFVGAKPITNDYTVSVSIVGVNGTWRAQHDGTPALGAIPTLKWIRGVTVFDDHDLHLPPIATGHGVLHLTVYDAFTMRLLPILDERLARLGQGTRIELGEVEVSCHR